MHEAYVGLGSNLDDPTAQLRAALHDLAALDGVTIVGTSQFFRTPPWGMTDQPDFINAVAHVRTRLTPALLLAELLALERRAGRSRSAERWGPRRLDLDLLLYDGWVSDDPAVQVPHPRMTSRAFVMVPLAELAPDLVVPGHGRVDALLAALDPEERAAVVALEPPRMRTE